MMFFHVFSLPGIGVNPRLILDLGLSPKKSLQISHIKFLALDEPFSIVVKGTGKPHDA